MIVEQTQYFAKPGHENDVLATRRRACEVRRELGLNYGQVLTRAEGSDQTGPTVVWQCSFASADDHAADFAARAGSEAFRAVRAEMSTHVVNFARYILCDDRAPDTDGMPGEL